MSDQFLHLFEGYGIEMEYMIVHNETLSVLPISDQILYSIAGEFVEDVERGPIAWSNELVLHLIELKTNGPSPLLEGLPEKFQTSIAEINQILSSKHGQLLGSGMHPWMNPTKEMQLWPHGYNEVYETYDRIFNCRHHGFSNLQSTHLNLPFANDEELGRLHAAIRLILPILPALSASSPVMEEKLSGKRDTRLDIYRKNQIKVPSIAGKIIPEQVFTRREYEEKIFHRIWNDIAPYDPKGLLRYEWLNSRGAIVRFDRYAIEIRILDIQECPLADLSIMALIVQLLKALVSEEWISYEKQKSWPVEALEPLFLACIQDAENTVISDISYLQTLGISSAKSCTAGDVWKQLTDRLFQKDQDRFAQRWKPALDIIFNQGTLSTRIIKALNNDLSRENLRHVYRKLSHCLSKGTLFTA